MINKVTTSHEGLETGQATFVQAARLQAKEVTAYDLIVAMNTLRTSNGLPALIEDPIIDAVAQVACSENQVVLQVDSHVCCF